MNFRPPLKKLVLALGVLAVMCAQIFGIGNGFLCDCSGRPEFTESDHCHGPHGADCHKNAEPTHSEASHPAESDTHSHPRIAQDFQSMPALATEFVLAEPVLRILLTLDDSAWTYELSVRASGYAADERGSPPSGVAVARTVVLLI